MSLNFDSYGLRRQDTTLNGHYRNANQHHILHNTNKPHHKHNINTNNKFQQSQDENILSEKAVSFNFINFTPSPVFLNMELCEHLNL